jgi:low affinity Fe/Cu permease
MTAAAVAVAVAVATLDVLMLIKNVYIIIQYRDTRDMA